MAGVAIVLLSLLGGAAREQAGVAGIAGGGPPISAAASAAQAAARPVFALYFVPLPSKIDNVDASVDYYTVNHLNPHGENDQWVAQGGFLRDRPLPVPVRRGDYHVLAMADEVRTAAAYGLSGFANDVLSDSGQNWDWSVDLMTAADTVGGFRIMLTPDMGGEMQDYTPAREARVLARLAAHRSAYRLPDGRLVVAPFWADQKTPSWWTETFALLRRDFGITVAFEPILLNPGASLAAFLPISSVVGNWGNRNPGTVASETHWAAQAHAAGVKWMAPVSPQDERPRSSIYDEADNSQLLRDMWDRAGADHADQVLVATWNDDSENTGIRPSELHGYALLDLFGYYLTRFQTGTAPTITRDTLVVSFRNQAVTGTDPIRPAFVSIAPMVQRPGDTRSPLRDDVEALTMLTAPATVHVTVGDSSWTYLAPAGVHTELFPLRPGLVAAQLLRNDVTIGQVASPDVPAYRISSTPYRQDTTYRFLDSRYPTPATVGLR